MLYWYTGSNEPGFESIKVDILVPGVMDLPHVPPRFIININELPCAPLHLLLLQKLQAWYHRRHSPRPDFRAKVPGDIQDIEDLLHIANQRGLKLTKRRPYITNSFREKSYKRVKKFTYKYPEYTEWWESLGLEL